LAHQVGGVLAARLGTALSSIIATSLIFLGQAILLFGDVTGSITGMAFGLFIFGLGISPLAVVQETIIVRFFSKHGLGVSLALGLLAGKGASFASALTSYPLSESYGPHAPFVVATMLAGFSFGINMLYVAGSGWFARGAGIEPEEAEMRQTIKRNNIITQVERMSELEALQKVVAKRRIRFWDITNLGDIFWAYIAINGTVCLAWLPPNLFSSYPLIVLCGAIWSPFTHLAAYVCF
jgi:MFS family permease